jgi:GNAT superfamily N-acetyltransferase
MSDGPYRSLPMSRSWKRLAEFSENENFAFVDTCAAAVNALEKTWRSDVPATVIEGVRKVFLEKQSTLFSDQRVEEVEALAPKAAGHGIGKLLLEHTICVMHEGGSGESGLVEATERALTAYGARTSRQIEEHYLRKASAPLTKQVSKRVEQALGNADRRALARQLCGLESGAARRPSLKHKDIDDGVPL